jgi:tetratricopeptide (TPR) repeat protein
MSLLPAVKRSLANTGLYWRPRAGATPASWRAFGCAVGLTLAVSVWAQETSTGAPADALAPDLAPGVAHQSAAMAGSAALGPEASISDVYTGFRNAFDAREYPEAASLAQRVLTLTEQQAKTPADEAVQVALMNLALAQQLAGDYVAAESSYLRIIELIEQSGRPLSARLARAHAGLATTYHDARRHERAVERFEQAIGMSRRHEGLLNQQQVPLLEKYSDSLTQLGRYEDALQAQRYILRVETRGLGADDPRLAPALERIGRWYASVGAYDQSRRAIKRALEVVTRAEGDRSPGLVGPLLALAECNRRQLYDPSRATAATPDGERASMFHDPSSLAPPSLAPGMLASEGEKALQLAADLAESRPEPSLIQVADVRTQLGDWYQLRGDPERALSQYLQAWQTAARVTERAQGKSLVELLFDTPALLHYARPEAWDRYAGRKAGEAQVLTVSAQLTVDEMGRPVDVRLTDDSGDARRAEKTLQAIATARYRPRFDNGRPVATPDVAFSQPWIVPLEPAESVAKPAGAMAPNGS